MPAASGTEARNGPKKRPMKMLGTPQSRTKASPLGQDFRIVRQRPDLGDLLLVFVAEPVGDPVAERRAEAAGEPHRPEADAGNPDQRANGDQRAPGGDQQRNEGQRLAKGQHQHDRRRPMPDARARNSRPSARNLPYPNASGPLGFLVSQRVAGLQVTMPGSGRERPPSQRPSLFKPKHGIVRATDSHRAASLHI